MNMRFDPERLIDSKAKLKILKYVMHDPFTATTSSLARLAKMPVMTAHRVMAVFEEAGLVASRKIGTALEWSANKDSYAYKMLLKIYKPLMDYKTPVEMLKQLVEETLPPQLMEEATLYGSMARGDVNKDSDIDLFVMVKKESDKAKFEKYGNALDEKTQKLFGKPVMTYLLTEKEYKAKAGLEVIKNIKKEGIRLSKS